MRKTGTCPQSGRRGSVRNIPSSGVLTVHIDLMVYAAI